MPNPTRIDATVGQVCAFSTGPAAVRDLAASGVTAGQVRSALAAGGLLTLRRGIVVPRVTWDAGSDDDRRRWALEAALLAFPDGFASHDSAARLHGLPDYGLDRSLLNGVPVTHITRRRAARQDDWLRVHGCDTPYWCVTERQGLPTTDLVRTSIELSATRSLRTAIVFLDAATRLAIENEVGDVAVREAVHDAGMRARIRRQWRDGLGPYARHRWVTSVRLALDHVEPAAESPLESLSRMAILDTDLPRPRCGVPIRGDDGRLYWVDMAWDEQRLIGEADGALKYATPEAFLQEKRRQEALEGEGWRFVRWGWPEVVPDSRIMLRRIRRALAP